MEFISLGSSNWTVVNEQTKEQYPVHVPGFVHKDLTEQGVMPDVYDTLLESKVEWAEYTDWTYVTAFSLASGLLESAALELVFDGIDTYADIWLNGKLLGHTENMWLPARFDIRGIAALENRLEVRIAAPTRTLLEKEAAFGDKLQLWNGIPARLFGRKPQYGYGWDWGPRLVTAGIPKDVRIEAHEGFTAGRPVYQLPYLTPDKAVLSVQLPVTNTLDEARSAEIVWQLFDGETVVASKQAQAVLQPGSNVCAASLELANPKLWYPAGYGEQPLYRLEAAVVVEGAAHKLESGCTAGLRNVRLLQPYDEQGRKFVFEINGIPVLCKGVNWIPLTLYPNLDTAEGYREEIAGIANANMNMIRIWGGGTYENHAFYEECDRLGIMVWQDFMFACGDYPDDDAFCALVRREAEHVIADYGYHPSIVLWCGNNENQHFIVRSKRNRKEGYGERLFFDVLDEVTAKDKLRPYWPTSPYDLSADSDANGEANGDMHYWLVWGQTHPYEEYGQINGRFLSEFGMQSYPSMRVLNQVDEEADLRDPKFTVMQKAPNGTQRLMYYTSGDYRLPADKEGFVYVNQLMQANALRLAVEHWISRMPDTSGALIWQWSDLWPSISWAITDYGKVRKPSYFYMKRSFQSPNAILKLQPDSSEAQLYLIHDKGNFAGQITVEFYDIAAERVIQTERIEAAGSGYRSTKAGSVNVSGFDPATTVVFVHLHEGGKLLARSSYLLGKPHGLKLKPAKLKVEQETVEAGVQLTVTSDVFAKDVWFPDVAGELSDNGFDLKAGESRTILLPDTAGFIGSAAPQPVCLNGIQTVGYL